MSGSTVLIPGGSLGEVRRSLDSGVTVSIVPGTPELCLIGKNEVSGRWIGMWINNEIYHSDDDGDTFTYGATVSDATFSVGCNRWSMADGRVAFGGSNAGQTAPKLFTTLDGIGITNEALPVFTGGSKYITAIYEWGDYFVVGTELGEVAYKIGEVWTLSSDTLGCGVNQITDNGFELVMIGGIGPEDSTGFIKSTTDLVYLGLKKALLFLSLLVLQLLLFPSHDNMRLVLLTRLWLITVLLLLFTLLTLV